MNYSTFEDCDFYSSVSIGNGGVVMENMQGSTTIYNRCNFEENQALYGGAVALIGASTSVFTSCTFLKNQAVNTAGAIDMVYNYCFLSS
jgi:hypothetical protein